MDIKKILFRTSSFDVEKSLPDATVLCAKDGKIQWVNDIAIEMFETSKMHLLTSNISDFIENAMNFVTTAIITQKPLITKIQNKETYYEMTARDIEESYVLSFRTAVFDRQEVNCEEEERINTEKNNFLLKLSNDLKSPVQSIVGFSQAMADGLGGEMTEQQEKYIRIINKNSSDLMYFIAKMLELSKTELGIKAVDSKPLDVLALAHSVVKFNEQLYKGKEVNISIIPEEGFKKNISSDSEILKSVLQDLLEVILKAVDMGDINIKLSNPDSEFLASKNITEGIYTMISLSSSSLLFSENDLDCLFEPYKILDTTNRKNVLRAITLASVQNMLKALNGTIWVESQILKSTSFNVILPNQ